MQKDKIRVALLGAAHDDVSTWVRLLKAGEGAEILALWDHDVERGQRTAALWDVRFQPDLEKLLSDRGTVAVCIGAETGKRMELISHSLAVGKHVLYAPPPALTVEQFDRAFGLLPKNGPPGFPWLPMRFDPMAQRVRAMITGGKIAKVDMLRLRIGSKDAWLPGFTRSWQANPELSGGGVFMDHGFQAVDYLHSIFGAPTDVVAQMESSILPAPVEDNVIALYRFPRSVIAEVACSWTVHAATNTLEAYGEGGTLVVQGNDPASAEFTHDEFPRLYCTDFQERRWQPIEVASAYRREDYHRRVLSAFLDVVAGRAPLPVSLSEVRDSLVMVQGAYEAARQRRRMVFTMGERGLGFRPDQ